MNININKKEPVNFNLPAIDELNYFSYANLDELQNNLELADKLKERKEKLKGQAYTISFNEGTVVAFNEGTVVAGHVEISYQGKIIEKIYFKKSETGLPTIHSIKY